MTQTFHIEPDRTGAQAGVIAHLDRPRFCAHWVTGTDLLATIDGPCWSDAGTDDDDSIQLYAFQWTDPMPAQAAFEQLMQQAVSAIDDWIAGQL